MSGGSPLKFVLDDTGRFLYERPVTGARKYLYRHDGLGRLVSAEKQNAQGQIVSTTTYGYTADGRLAWRKDGAADREWLIYDGSQAVVQIQQPSQGVAALTWTHVWAGNRLVRTTRHQGQSASYVRHQDRLGSIVLLRTLGDGSLEKKLYDPYGRVVAVPTDSTTSPLPIPYGYAGARWEATAGLYQMGARWYDPELGRFIEQDPIGEAGGLNLYAYVGSSPTLWVDPTGLARQGVGGSVIGGGPVNRTSQRQLLVDGTSTSDVLTGSSGGWLDWGSRHQTDYWGPSYDQPGYDPKTPAQRRAERGASGQEAKGAAGQGGDTDLYSIIATFQRIGAELGPWANKIDLLAISSPTLRQALALAQQHDAHFSVRDRATPNYYHEGSESDNIPARTILLPGTTDGYTAEDIARAIVHETTHLEQHMTGRFPDIRQLSEDKYVAGVLKAEAEAFTRGMKATEEFSRAGFVVDRSSLEMHVAASSGLPQAGAAWERAATAAALAWVSNPDVSPYPARAHANWRSYHAQAK